MILFKLCHKNVTMSCNKFPIPTKSLNIYLFFYALKLLLYFHDQYWQRRKRMDDDGVSHLLKRSIKNVYIYQRIVNLDYLYYSIVYSIYTIRYVVKRVYWPLGSWYLHVL